MRVSIPATLGDMDDYVFNLTLEEPSPRKHHVLGSEKAIEVSCRTEPTPAGLWHLHIQATRSLTRMFQWGEPDVLEDTYLETGMENVFLRGRKPNKVGETQYRLVDTEKSYDEAHFVMTAYHGEDEIRSFFSQKGKLLPHDNFAKNFPLVRQTFTFERRIASNTSGYGELKWDHIDFGVDVFTVTCATPAELTKVYEFVSTKELSFCSSKLMQREQMMKYDPIINQMRDSVMLPWSFVDEELRGVPKNKHVECLADALETLPQFDRDEWIGKPNLSKLMYAPPTTLKMYCTVGSSNKRVYHARGCRLVGKAAEVIDCLPEHRAMFNGPCGVCLPEESKTYKKHRAAMEKLKTLLAEVANGSASEELVEDIVEFKKK